jgi:hypothetical protein
MAGRVRRENGQVRRGSGRVIIGTPFRSLQLYTLEAPPCVSEMHGAAATAVALTANVSSRGIARDCYFYELQHIATSITNGLHYSMCCLIERVRGHQLKPAQSASQYEPFRA